MRKRQYCQIFKAKIVGSPKKQRPCRCGPMEIQLRIGLFFAKLIKIILLFQKNNKRKPIFCHGGPLVFFC